MVRTILIIVVLLVSFSGLHVALQLFEDAILLDQSIRMDGVRLLSFISVNLMDKKTDDQRSVFSKAIMDSFSFKGISYLTLHSADRKTLFQLIDAKTAVDTPEKVVNSSLSADVPTVQRYHSKTFGGTIYEFSKPSMLRQQKVILRMGLLAPKSSVFSMHTVRTVALLSIFMLTLLFLGMIQLKSATKPFFSIKTKYYISDNEYLPEKEEKMPWHLFFNFNKTREGGEIIVKEIEEIIHRLKREKTRLRSETGILSYEKKQMEDIINKIHTGVLLTNIQDTVIFVNDSAANLIRKKKENILDRRLDGIVENSELLSYFHNMGSFGKEATQDTIEAALPEFSTSDIYRIHFKTLFDANKTPISKLILFHNITREVLSEKAHLEFTTHLTHELMTPLTSIKSYSEMLMEGDVTDFETQKEFYNTINQETDRLAGLIKDLLNLSKIETGSFEFNKNIVRSDWLFEDCFKTIEGSAQKKQITLERDAPDNFPILIGDKELLKTAIINILGNAVKYTPEKGSIRFSLSENSGTVLFKITDTGYGIPQKDIGKIFQKFFRSDHPDTFSIQGSGLGLAITKEIVRLHDGEIKVISSVGKGSTFLIEIPKEEYYLAT